MSEMKDKSAISPQSAYQEMERKLNGMQDLMEKHPNVIMSDQWQADNARLYPEAIAAFQSLQQGDAQPYSKWVISQNQLYKQLRQTVHGLEDPNAVTQTKERAGQGLYGRRSHTANRHTMFTIPKENLSEISDKRVKKASDIPVMTRGGKSALLSEAARQSSQQAITEMLNDKATQERAHRSPSAAPAA